jgi:hypothetical protein
VARDGRADEHDLDARQPPGPIIRAVLPRGAQRCRALHGIGGGASQCDPRSRTQSTIGAVRPGSENGCDERPDGLRRAGSGRQQRELDP